MTGDGRTAQRRREILAAAEKVFSARGYAAARVDDVAAEAGLAKGSLYNYFRSKQELFTQVFYEAIAPDEADVDRILSADLPAGEKLESVLDTWGRRLEYFTHIGGLMLEFWATAARQDASGQLAGVFRDLYARSRERIGRIVAEGVASGEFSRDVAPRLAASLIVAMVDGICVQSILGMGVNVDAEFLAAMKRNILARLTAGPKEAGSRGADAGGERHEEA